MWTRRTKLDQWMGSLTGTKKMNGRCDTTRNATVCEDYADRDVSRELFFKSRGLIKNDLRCRNFFN